MLGKKPGEESAMIRTIKKGNKRSSKLTFPSCVYQGISMILVRSIPYMPSAERYNITICHEKKFLWFRVAKVGTRTVFDVLEQANINLDAELSMKCHYPINKYKEYFKFAFVRNPWDRLVSCWLNKVVNANYFQFSADRLLEMQKFENFVNFVADHNIERCDHHIRLQSKLIDLNNVDYIGRFEDFEEHLLKVIQLIGLDSINIKQKNASKNRTNYRQYYDESLRNKVAEIYGKDINIFSYDY